VQPGSSSVPKPVVKQFAAAGKARSAPAPKEIKAAETKPAEEPAAEAQPPVPQQAEATLSTASAPESAAQTQPAEQPKKVGFWGKLNPFRGKASKKKKDDSALRSTGEVSAEGHQE
jgi:hypothetical protein